MLHVYKIDSVQQVFESIEEIMENEGRPLYDILVKDVIYIDYFNNAPQMLDDIYEGGWPVLFEGKEDNVGFCVNDYSEVDFTGVAHLNERRMDRHFFIRTEFDNKPKVGDHFAFLNQYEKRISNEEIQEVLKQCQDDKTDTCFTIGADNKLHKVE